MNMTLKELGALLRRELAKWLGVGVHGLGVQWRGIVSLSQGRRSAGEEGYQTPALGACRTAR
jgi:hypothetical protein